MQDDSSPPGSAAPSDHRGAPVRVGAPEEAVARDSAGGRSHRLLPDLAVALWRACSQTKPATGLPTLDAQSATKPGWAGTSPRPRSAATHCRCGPCGRRRAPHVKPRGSVAAPNVLPGAARPIQTLPRGCSK